MNLEYTGGNEFSDKAHKRLKVELPQSPEIQELVDAIQALIRKEFNDPNLNLTLGGFGFSTPAEKPYILIDGKNPRWDGKYRGSGLF